MDRNNKRLQSRKQMEGTEEETPRGQERESDSEDAQFNVSFSQVTNTGR